MRTSTRAGRGGIEMNQAADRFVEAFAERAHQRSQHLHPQAAMHGRVESVGQADAVVEHSHDYDAAETRKRGVLILRGSAVCRTYLAGLPSASRISIVVVIWIRPADVGWSSSS